MSHLVFTPFEPEIENTTRDFTRFTALYDEKRELESGIENSIWEIDRIATSELKSAEEELQETNLKCANIFARLERAAGSTLRIIFCVQCISDIMIKSLSSSAKRSRIQTRK
jgi:hypothetical protein